MSPAAAVQESLSEREFEATVLREKRRLFALAVSILADAGEAEDAVQETLVRAWRAWATLDSPDRVGPWLVKVCVNLCISRRRGLMRSGWLHRGPLRPTLAAPLGAGLGEALMDFERAYARLSTRQRTALTLNYRYGYSVDECAEVMGCRPGTVRSHLARALDSLRREIGDV